MQTNPFKTELENNIRAKIKELKRNGTVGMGLNNLKMVTKTPKTSEGAPQGGNIEWQYANIFREVVESNKSFKSFILMD